MDKNFLTKDISELMSLYNPSEYRCTQNKIIAYLNNKFDEINNSLNSVSYKTLVLTIVWETCDPTYWKDNFQKFLTQLKQLHNELEIIVIFESWFEPFQLNFNSITRIYYIDFWVYKVYEFLIVQRTSQLASEWDSTGQHVLFMTDKSNKIHQTRLLYKLLNSEIKDCLLWSYQVDQQHLNASLAFLNDLSTDQQKNFLSLATRDLDGYFSASDGVRSTKFNSDIYKNSVLQIISETDFDRPLSQPFITEKTWISIVNYRPFIIASELGHLTELNKRGIRTFNQYLAVPNYDNPDLDDFLTYGPESDYSGRFFCTQEFEHWKSFYRSFKDQSWIDIDSITEIRTLPNCVQQELNSAYCPGYYSLGEIRLDAIVENAMFFKQNFSKHATKINEDTQHNFRIFLELAKNAQKTLEDLQAKHQLSCKHLYDVFEMFI